MSNEQRRDAGPGMFRSAFIYMGSSVANRAIPFFLLPILTRYMSPEEYGTLALFQVCLVLVTPVVDLNISQNIARKFFGLSKDELAEYIANILLILLASFSLVLIFVSIVTAVTDNILGIPDRWLLAIPLIALMNMLNKCNLVIFVQEKKPFHFGLFEVGSAIINMGVSLTLVVGLAMGWQGRASGLLVTSLVAGLAGLIYMYARKYIKPSVNRASISEILSVALPTVPHVLGMILIGFSDRLFIEWMVGTGEVGLYDVGYKIGMITMLVSDAFFRAWTPWYFKRIIIDDPEVRLAIVRRTYLFIAGLFALAAVVTVAARLTLPIMVDEAFLGAQDFVMWIAFAYAARGIYQMMQFYLLHLGRTKFLPVGTGAAVVVNLVLNYVLIRLNGPVGAAQASLAAFFVMSFATWWFAARIHPMPWFDFGRILARR